MSDELKAVLHQIDDALDLYHALRQQSQFDDCSDMSHHKMMEVAARLSTTLKRFAPPGSHYLRAISDLDESVGLAAPHAYLANVPGLLVALRGEYEASILPPPARADEGEVRSGGREDRLVELSHERVPTAPAVEATHRSGQWDAFICYAGEDKESFVQPLVEALKQAGPSVWYDDFTLRMGDSLCRAIDRGLRQSRFGIVVLSRAFLAKEWPQRELDGLATKEVDGQKVILPVWYRVMAEDILRYSSALAGRVAAKSSEGLEEVVRKLTAAIGSAGRSP